MNDNEAARAHITVHGNVQGVFYRASARDQASRLGVNGWIQNNDDGTVEAVIEGPRDQVEAFIVWAADGPPRAEVQDVDRSWEEYTGELSGFEVRR